MIEPWLKHNEKAAQFVQTARSSRERHIRAYIVYSLFCGQEYDGGNAILSATQDGSLGQEAVRWIATLFVSGEIRFSSRIGQLLFVKIGRSLGLYLFDHGQDDLGRSLLRMAVETTSHLDYGKETARHEWEDFKLQAAPIPAQLNSILRGLE